MQSKMETHAYKGLCVFWSKARVQYILGISAQMRKEINMPRKMLYMAEHAWRQQAYHPPCAKLIVIGQRLNALLVKRMKKQEQ